MIDVQPYIDRLEKLKKIIDATVEIKVQRIKMWEIYTETGMMPIKLSQDMKDRIDVDVWALSEMKKSAEKYLGVPSDKFGINNTDKGTIPYENSFDFEIN